MFNFLKKRKGNIPTPEESPNSSTDKSLAENVNPPIEKPSLLQRLKVGLQRTRTTFSESLANVFLGKKTIDAALLEQLETHLLLADVGLAATAQIMADLTKRVARKQLADPTALMTALQDDLANLLQPCEMPLTITEAPKPFVILMMGINGAGKTTTIGKLAKQFQAQQKSVLLAAGDTFRAAAIEQLQAWGERNNIPVIAQHSGADSASVIFDALQAAKARNIDIVIADTAGRLHTQHNLIDELKKIKRVITRFDATAPHETLLVLDAGTGQNALQQARQFHESVGITGIALTKLDGTAKGGIIFAIAKQLSIPIRFIGIGEGIDDLKIFHAKEFVNALFDNLNLEPTQQ